MGILTLNEDLLADIKAGKAPRALFVEMHPRFTQHLLVNSLNEADFKARMQHAVSAVRVPEASPNSDPLFVVPPFGPEWDEFVAAADEQGFEIIMMPGTQDEIDALVAKLNATPEVRINSEMPNTINGFLKFQAQGFNMVKDELAGWLYWSTGTGKTVGAAGLVKYHQQLADFDLAIWCAKAHNKHNAARALAALVDIEAIVIHGTKAKREKLYREVARKMAAGERPTIIVNYEQFRGDKAFFQALVANHSILMVMDEAPTKLRNRRTQTWKSLCEVLYTSNMNGAPYPDRKALRPSELRAYVTSATPIENSPLDFFNVIRLIAPKTLGSAKQFDAQHVIWGTMNIVGRGGRIIQTKQVQGYRNLDQIGVKVAHMMHTVDKTDADIAAQFPKVWADEITVDLSDHQQKLYNKLAVRYRDSIRKFADLQKGQHLTDDDKRELQKLRAVFTVLQMIVDDPALVLDSAIEWEKGGHTPGVGSEVAQELRDLVNDDSQFEDDGEETRVAKNEALRELIEANDEKVIAFATHGRPYQQRLAKWLDKWGIGYVIYNGSMSLNQKQQAEDTFKTDPNCKLFLSSDAGSDSINLEVSDLAVHINLPWKPATYEQRENRINRITSKFGTNRVVTLFTDTLPEQHKAEILDEKRQYQRKVKRSAGAISKALRDMEDAA